MFSYLKSIQKEVSPTVLQKGQKLYLDGYTQKFETMILDNWRAYMVTDKRQEYVVKVPLLHLLLDIEQQKLLPAAILESVHCDCEYFFSNGICKHVIGVLASLDNEFSLELKQQKQQRQKADNHLIDQIFLVNEKQKVTQFFHDLEEYFYTSGFGFNWLKKFCQEFAGKLNHDFFQNLEPFLLKHLETFEGEKKIVRLLYQTLLLDCQNWWQFWLKILPQLSAKNQLNLQIKIFKLTLTNTLKPVETKVELYFSQLKTKQKQQIIKVLNSEENLPDNTVNSFAILSSFLDWIEQNLHLFSVKEMLLISQKFPDFSENLEQNLAEKVKVNLDFVQEKEHLNEILETLENWLQVFGRTAFFEKSLDYAKQNLKNQKSFQKKLNKL